ncbi:MAG TPA: 23S rRNA (adenine(1618)-N(6))-methyltransferase RlmF [Prolixibacteraceae bacterium]|jgi:23S rRNA (adenine1618-N6)-methyltransferase|nr:23S rRNA (adenine(1618)-N(6))-methyltransferase RlmF [Prolixibacteraceae bacterium]
MRPTKKEQPKEKPKLHPRNKNLERYDFKLLIEGSPELAPFVKPNIHGEDSVDFNDTEGVKVLNKALLLHHYGISNWNLPNGYVYPPIPGRADYIHHMADFLCRNNYGKIPSGSQIKCMDVGVGASCIYPIIGNKEYGWSFIGSDIDPVATESANHIIESNPTLQGKVNCKLQTNPKDYFYGIIRKDELIDLSICNPPTLAFTKEAEALTTKKILPIHPDESTEPIPALGSQNHENYCDGGEDKFVRNMILQSKKFAANCFCFSTLVSKESNLKSMYRTLEQVEAYGIETIPMGQGNKASYIVVWTFLTTEEQNKWKNERWKVVKT